MFHLLYKGVNPCGFLVFWMLTDNRVLCCVDKDVEKMIGLLLRDAGDRLNEKVRNYFSVSLLDRVIRLFVISLSDVLSFLTGFKLPHISSGYNTPVFHHIWQVLSPQIDVFLQLRTADKHLRRAFISYWMFMTCRRGIKSKFGHISALKHIVLPVTSSVLIESVSVGYLSMTKTLNRKRFSTRSRSMLL